MFWGRGHGDKAYRAVACFRFNFFEGPFSSWRTSWKGLDLLVGEQSNNVANNTPTWNCISFLQWAISQAILLAASLAVQI